MTEKCKNNIPPIYFECRGYNGAAVANVAAVAVVNKAVVAAINVYQFLFTSREWWTVDVISPTFEREVIVLILLFSLSFSVRNLWTNNFFLLVTIIVKIACYSLRNQL